MARNQQVLAWIYNVLSASYHDVPTSYRDITEVLNTYAGLNPRNDVYTYPDGKTVLMVTLSGTVPVSFRGTTYHFPIAIWVPQAYPHHPPLIYLTPKGNMVIRPGQYVDPQGQVYHPHLAAWNQTPGLTLSQFLQILIDIFSREPPVAARSAAPPAAPPPPPQPSVTHNPPPHLAPSTTATPPQNPRRGPPPPEKASLHTPHTPSPAPAPLQTPQSTGGAPSLPPKQPLNGLSSVSSSSSRPGFVSPAQTGGYPQQRLASHIGGTHGQQIGGSSVPSRYQPAPALPPKPTGTLVYYGHPVPQGQIPQPHPGPHPVYAQHMQSPLPTQYHPMQPPYGPPPPQQLPIQSPAPTPALAPVPIPTPTPVPIPTPTPKPPPPDLMDIPSPISITPLPKTTPTSTTTLTEKATLLTTLSAKLITHHRQLAALYTTSLSGARQQTAALEHAMASLQSEMSTLAQFANSVSGNIATLEAALAEQERVIRDAEGKEEVDIDELLVAPSVVANQLYAAVCEERALNEVLGVLSRALEKGRISSMVFVKATRSVGRDLFLKRLLIKKIAQGMGLSMRGPGR